MDKMIRRGFKALNDYMEDLGLSISLEKIGINDLAQLHEIAFRYQGTYGICGRMTQKEVYSILKQCYEEGMRK